MNTIQNFESAVRTFAQKKAQELGLTFGVTHAREKGGVLMLTFGVTDDNVAKRQFETYLAGEAAGELQNMHNVGYSF